MAKAELVYSEHGHNCLHWHTVQKSGFGYVLVLCSIRGQQATDQPGFRSLGPIELKPSIETGQVQEIKKEFWFVLGRGCYACDSTLCTCSIASRNIANHIKNQYLEDTRTFTAGFAKILIKIWRPQDTAKG